MIAEVGVICQNTHIFQFKVLKLSSPMAVYTAAQSGYHTW